MPAGFLRVRLRPGYSGHPAPGRPPRGIHPGVAALDHGLAHASLLVRHDRAVSALPALAAKLSVNAVFVNHDDEPQALARDAGAQALLDSQGVACHSFKDHVIFERCEVLTQAGKPYIVFTPYKNAWLKKVDRFYLKPYPVEKYARALDLGLDWHWGERYFAEKLNDFE